jgi:hypothetical protein
VQRGGVRGVAVGIEFSPGSDGLHEAVEEEEGKLTTQLAHARVSAAMPAPRLTPLLAITALAAMTCTCRE